MFDDATRLGQRLASSDVTSVELVTDYLSRIERLNAPVNAFTIIDSEGAMTAARASDDRRAAGTSFGPLDGVPMTIKDEFNTVGVQSTSGFAELLGNVPDRDCTSVERLRGAGAVVMAKTTLPPGAADIQTYSPAFGTTNNPWDIGRTPGGSSGGAAVSLAMNFCGLELGSDIGGSIRTPASWTGVYGHKPTWGILPGRGWATGEEPWFTEVDIAAPGPMARSARDLRMAMTVLAGAGELDAPGWTLKLPASTASDLRGLRVAAWIDEPTNRSDAATVEVLTRLISDLESAGAIVDTEARPPTSYSDQIELYLYMLLAATSAEAPSDSALISHGEWLHKEAQRDFLRREWRDFFTTGGSSGKGIDVMIAPCVVTTAIAHQHAGGVSNRSVVIDGVTRPYMDMLWWAGLVGNVRLPSTAVPAGLGRNGLPVGAQIVGAPYADNTTIAVAELLDEAGITAFVPPPMALD